MTPFTALMMLKCHIDKKVRLTEGEFEQAFDQIVALLEEANDCKYRLQPDITNEKVEQ